jgi:hypothetical protein
VAEPAAADGAAPLVEAPSGPTTIAVGILPLHLGDLDLRTGTAVLTYYVWTRWTGPADGTAYEVMNGTELSRGSEYLYEEDGVRYAYYRCSTRVELQPDFHSFPFDEHLVGIELEHAEEGIEGVRFEVDEGGVQHLESPPVAGWLVDPPAYDVVESRYATNFGMPGVSPDEVATYPRFRMRIRLHHDVSTTFFKTFLTLFISVMIAFLGFFMHPDILDARVGVGVAGIFGAVTSHSVVAGNLPDIPYMTLSDRIHLAGIVFVFLALVESCAIGWLHRHGRAPLAERIDRIARWAMLPAFTALVAGFVALR